VSEAETITVEVDEEYGYRHWLWRTGLTAEQLLAFWRALEYAPFFNPSVLPGEWTQVHDHGSFRDDPEINALYTEMDAEGDGSDRSHELVELTTEAIGRYVDKFRAEREKALAEGKAPWTAHIHTEDDTYLCDNFGRRHHHAGYGKP